MDCSARAGDGVVQSDLIYDLGLHEAQDTEFYLKKGFRVVAIDANDRLCDQARLRFARVVDEGRLTLVNRAIAKEPGEITFYENVNTEWGTVDPDWVERNRRSGAHSQERTVTATTIGSILAEYGTPYYLKVDIEGMDLVALLGLRDVAARPSYVSIESDKVSFRQLRKEFDVLIELGYDRFKVVSQRSVPKQRVPNPAREGKYVEHTFALGSSGAFGEEAPGQWLSVEEAVEKYRRAFLQYALTGDDPMIRSKTVRNVLKVLGLRTNWYDTHAKHRGA